jgi:glycosyltransferase involved in cell wall biosynthesis
VIRLYWQGPFFATTSLALVNRRLVAALIQRGNLDISIGTDPFVPEKLAAAFRPLASRRTFGARDADVTVSHEWPPHFAAPASSRYVHYQPWEYGSMPQAWFDALCDDCDDLWVPSSFNQRSYADAGFDAARLAVIPHGVDSRIFFAGGPSALRDPSRFRFLFVGGSIYRKGIDILVDAYVRAFGGRRDVVLMIKDVNTTSVYRGHNSGDQLRALANNPNVPPIEYVDASVDDETLAGLFRSADCLVHPYRGEAFALPVLEAMGCGLPVIVTAGGATDDFVDETVGWRVAASQRTLAENEVPFPTRTTASLLEPNIAALAETMRFVFEHRDEARRRGAAGAARAQSWTWERAARIVESRIEGVFQRAPLPEKRRDANYHDASRYAERLFSEGELDGIIIELFKRLGIDRPAFAAVDAGHSARLLDEGLGWRREPSPRWQGLDLLVLGQGVSIDDIATYRARAIATTTQSTVDLQGYTCVARERLNGAELFVRDDLLDAAGFAPVHLVKQ